MSSDATPGPRDLRERTLDYASMVITDFTKLPRSDVAVVLGKQMLRSGTSVGGQDRESCRAKSDNDIISKLEGSLQELDETDYWVELLKRHQLMNEETASSIQRETNELTSIFVTIVRQIKNRR